MTSAKTIETATMTVEQYLADPAAASRLAEEVGRVLVLDAAGARRMTISSNRATEVLLPR